MRVCEQPRVRPDPAMGLLDIYDTALPQVHPHHRAALTLRYLDGLPVAQVAGHLGRTLHATEALLVRARAAFRTAYEDPEALR